MFHRWVVRKFALIALFAKALFEESAKDRFWVNSWKRKNNKNAFIYKLVVYIIKSRELMKNKHEVCILKNPDGLLFLGHRERAFHSSFINQKIAFGLFQEKQKQMTINSIWPGTHSPTNRIMSITQDQQGIQRIECVHQDKFLMHRIHHKY